jgi:DNA replication and repair protein RecF
MLLTHLSLTNYRNFARLDLDVPCGPLLLVGENAQGKTSLLEAIYYLATLTSFHASNDRELISFHAEMEPLAVARIVADFRHVLPETTLAGSRSPGAHRMEVRIIRDAVNGAPRMRKEVILDGVQKKVGEAYGVFNAVLFLPQMLSVVEGSPEDRRRYLNLSLGQVWPRYASNLAEYGRVLTQRNALLKALGERGGDPAQLNYWDEQLAALGAEVIYARIQAIQELERLARPFHLQLTRGQEMLRLDYQPSYDPTPASPLQIELPLSFAIDRSGISVEKIRSGFLSQLSQARLEEIQRGVTRIGPHRDEYRFISNGIDLGTYGSRGQGRTAVLSLKLAEVAWMKEKTAQWPVLLLDEVLAELDPARRVDLLSRLKESEQALLTTTDLDLFSADYVHQAKVWRIQAGQVISG